jgi:hypothetical protein
MKKTKEQRILLAATLMVAGLAAFILCGGMGLTTGADAASQSSPGQVRMEVDTTVISGDTVGLPPSEASPADQGPSDAARPDQAGEAAVPDEAKAGPAAAASAPRDSDPKASDPKAPAPNAQPAKLPAPNAQPSKTPASAGAARKPSAPGKPAMSGTVTGVSLESKPDGFVLTIVSDRPAGETAHFALSSPGRFVLDMPGSWRLTAPNVIRRQSGPVVHVVIGAHPDKMRFVVHFRDTAGVRTGTPVVTRDGSTLRLAVPLAR